MKAAVERMAIGVLVAGFAIGTTTHMLTLVDLGWVVNPAALVWMDGY